MRTSGIALLVLAFLSSSVAGEPSRISHGETNAIPARITQRHDRFPLARTKEEYLDLTERLASGEIKLPVRMAPGLYDKLVSDGTLPPPVDPSEQKRGYHVTGAPLSWVLDFYSELTGKTIQTNKSVNAIVTMRAPRLMTKDELSAFIRTQLQTEHRIDIVPVSTNAVRAIWLPRTPEEKSNKTNGE